MKSPPISVAVDDLRRDVKSGLDLARNMGFRHVDLSALSGPVSPGELTASGRRHLMRHLNDLGLRLDSLRGPTGGPGYADGAAGERRLESMKRIIELASQLQVPVVSTALGGFSNANETAQAARLKEAMELLADHADAAGVIVALETAGVSSADLSGLLRTINCPMLRACCDTGALLMQGEDPASAGDVLAGQLGLARVRDALLGSAGVAGHETAMGQGQLDPAAFLAGLSRAAYSGPLVLSRTTGENPAADILAARRIFSQFGA